MLRKFVNILRTHPKKCIFFGGLGGYGINLMYAKHKENCMMAEYCEEALKYGEEPIPCNEASRHVTVILNPSAGDGKSKALYDKYCAPLLHLAGFKVALVRTEREGQAVGIMGVMANTEAVVVAGGDGTFREVLTGMLSRPDIKHCANVLPLGLIPLGETNTTASTIGVSGSQAKRIAEATMAVIKQTKQKLNVMEITPLETDSDKPSKSIYAASQLDWGAFRDGHERISKYWYYGKLKKYVAYIFSSYADLSWNCDADLEWTLPCSGCQKCKAQQMIDAENSKKAAYRWWHAFLPSKPEEVAINYSTITNENCGKTIRHSTSGVPDIRVSTSNTPLTKDTPSYALNVQIGKPNLGTLEFIQEGWRRERNEMPNNSQKILVGDISIWPKDYCLTKRDNTPREYTIDNELFDVRPMKLKAMPEAVTVFAPNPHIDVKSDQLS